MLSVETQNSVEIVQQQATISVTTQHSKHAAQQHDAGVNIVTAFTGRRQVSCKGSVGAREASSQRRGFNREVTLPHCGKAGPSGRIAAPLPRRHHYRYRTYLAKLQNPPSNIYATQ